MSSCGSPTTGRLSFSLPASTTRFSSSLYLSLVLTSPSILLSVSVDVLSRAFCFEEDGEEEFVDIGFFSEVEVAKLLLLLLLLLVLLLVLLLLLLLLLLLMLFVVERRIEANPKPNFLVLFGILLFLFSSFLPSIVESTFKKEVGNGPELLVANNRKGNCLSWTPASLFDFDF
jgi:hypothetical protein